MSDMPQKITLTSLLWITGSRPLVSFVKPKSLLKPLSSLNPIEYGLRSFGSLSALQCVDISRAILSVSKRFVEKSRLLVKFWKLSSEGILLSSRVELMSGSVLDSVGS